MKFKLFVLMTTLMLALGFVVPAQAAFDSGSSGADGAFTPTANTVLQVPESGIFNYTTVNIPAGVTITFTKNSKNTPVTILAIGDVTIAGTVTLNGANGGILIPGAGNVGGFDGGSGGTVLKSGKRGDGTGGGFGGLLNASEYRASGGGGGGGFGTGGGNGTTWSTSGGAGGVVYGNENVVPAIGGSGGGGGGGTTTYTGGGGGGGGGSIVIASSGTISVSGTITANGGTGGYGESNCGGAGGAGGGSGGSIRLIANIVTGNGTITATGGGGSGCNNPGGGGGAGRIRFDAWSLTRTAVCSPYASTGYPYSVVPQAMPVLSIMSVGGMQTPTTSKGAITAPDMMLPYNTQNPVTIVVSGTNIPVGTTVTVKASPAIGSAVSQSGALAGTSDSSTVSVQLTISLSYPSIITASVTLTVTASNGGPIFAQGERVEKIRIDTAAGGGSTMTYITESGKEIPVKHHISS